MNGHLVPAGGGKSIPLKKSPLLLGKRSKNSNGDSGSGHFCKLVFAAGRWRLYALDDAVEVRVNGQPIEKVVLKPGNLISIGKLRYRIDYEPEVDEEEANQPREKKGLFKRIWGGAETQQVSDQPSILGVLVPTGGGKPTPLRKERNTVGRDPACDVFINQNTVSSIHCGLEYQKGHWRIVDLGSRNGTMVNGVDYKRKWITPDDILIIGFVRFRLEYVPQGDKPTDDEFDIDTSRSLTSALGIDDKAIDRIAERDHEIQKNLRQTPQTLHENLSENSNLQQRKDDS